MYQQEQYLRQEALQALVNVVESLLKCVCGGEGRCVCGGRVVCGGGKALCVAGRGVVLGGGGERGTCCQRCGAAAAVR